MTKSIKQHTISTSKKSKDGTFCISSKLNIKILATFYYIVIQSFKIFLLLSQIIKKIFKVDKYLVFGKIKLQIIFLDYLNIIP